MTKVATKIPVNKANYTEISRKQVDLHSLRTQRNKFNWNLLAMYREFTLGELCEFSDLIEPSLLFRHSPFSEEIADSVYGKQLDWVYLVASGKLTLEQYRKYKEFILSKKDIIKSYSTHLSQTILQSGSPQDIRDFIDVIDWVYFKDSFMFDNDFLEEFAHKIDWSNQINYESRWGRLFVNRFARYIDWSRILDEHYNWLDEATILVMIGLGDDLYPYITPIVDNISDTVLMELIPYLTTLSNEYIPHTRKKFAGLDMLTALWEELEFKMVEDGVRPIVRTNFKKDFLSNLLVNNLRLNSSFIGLLERILKNENKLDFLDSLEMYSYNIMPNMAIVKWVNYKLEGNLYDKSHSPVTIEDYEHMMKDFPDIAFSEEFPNNVDMFIDVMIEYGNTKQLELLHKFIMTRVNEYSKDTKTISEILERLEEKLGIKTRTVEVDSSKPTEEGSNEDGEALHSEEISDNGNPI